MININNKGLSLIEILIAIAVFAVLGMLISSSLILTIQGSKKSESLMNVRENLNYSLSVIERNLRNASSIISCDPSSGTSISFYDQYKDSTSFSCVINPEEANDVYIASGSSRLTSNTITIVNCNITCNGSLVTIDVTAKDKLNSGQLSAQVSEQKNIYIRSE